MAVGTLPQGSRGYAIAAGVAQAVPVQTGIDMRAVGQGRSSVFISAVARSDLAFSTSNAFEAVFATQGTGPSDFLPNPDIRIAALRSPPVLEAPFRRWASPAVSDRV